MEGYQAKAFGQALLCNVKALGKLLVSCCLVHSGAQAVDGPSEEKGCSGIEGQVEEQWLQVDSSGGWYAHDQVLDVFSKSMVKLLIVGSDELLAQKLSGVFPGGTFLGEDATAQEGGKDGGATTETIVCALRTRLAVGTGYEVSSS